MSEPDLSAEVWMREGTRLGPADVQLLEARVAADPEDFESRSRLLGALHVPSLRDAAIRDRFLHHARWVVENRPESEIAGNAHPMPSFGGGGDAELEDWEALWRRVLAGQSDRPRALANAARFFLFTDSTAAKDLLLRARAMEPDNADWPERIGRLLSAAPVNMISKRRERPPRASRESDEQARARFSEALGYFEEALAKVQDPKRRAFFLIDACRTAFSAGALEKASDLAAELVATANLLSGNWSHGLAVHYGNIVLGRVALREGRASDAGRHLIESSRMGGGPQLNSFGPDFDLARELLQAGERECVVAYLDACQNFWRTGKSKLEYWKFVIENGETPSLNKMDP